MSMSQGKEVEERVDERSVDDLLSFINGRGNFCFFISIHDAMLPHIGSCIEPTLMLILTLSYFNKASFWLLSA